MVGRGRPTSSSVSASPAAAPTPAPQCPASPPRTHLGVQILLQQLLELCVLPFQRTVFYQQLSPLGQDEALGRKIDKRPIESSSTLDQVGTRISALLFWLEVNEDPRSLAHQGSLPGLKEPSHPEQNREGKAGGSDPPTLHGPPPELPKAVLLSKSSWDREAAKVAAPSRVLLLPACPGPALPALLLLSHGMHTHWYFSKAVYRASQRFSVVAGITVVRAFQYSESFESSRTTFSNFTGTQESLKVKSTGTIPLNLISPGPPSSAPHRLTVTFIRSWKSLRNNTCLSIKVPDPWCCCLRYEGVSSTPFL